jgi:phage portal protein BeeE
VLTAPGSISNEVAGRLKTSWEENFSASNIGRIAVLGDGLKYEAMTINAHDAQLIEQLKMTGEMIAACFHVPGYKIGVGQMPTVNNTAVLNQQYYDQCLQYLIEKLELRLNHGLELINDDTVEFDLSGLLRMDPQTRYAAHQAAINGGWKKPDEARMEENLPPVPGGDQVYMQRQNSSLEALAARDNLPVEGAQAAGLQSILDQVALGKLPVETAKATIKAMFPTLPDESINAMLTPLENFKAKPDAPPPESDDEEEELDVDKMLLTLRSANPETICHA